MVLWIEGKILTFENEEFCYIFDIQYLGNDKIFIMTNPCGQKISIWKLDINSITLNKISNLHDLGQTIIS